MIGTYFGVRSTPSDSFTDILSNVSLVYEYDISDTSNPWRIFDPAAPDYANDLDWLRPGFGYWILTEDVDVWTVDY